MTSQAGKYGFQRWHKMIKHVRKIGEIIQISYDSSIDLWHIQNIYPASDVIYSHTK